MGKGACNQLVYTIGYGGRSLQELLSLIEAFGIRSIIDVRRWNRTVSNPSFSGANLERSLKEIGVGYYWYPMLGGYRRFGVDVDDHGVGYCFESPGFRAYANYIVYNESIKPYLFELLKLASREVIALLCAERYPWRCHRKILSDYFVAKGFRVMHIIDEKTVYEHKLSSCAVVDSGELRYI